MTKDLMDLFVGPSPRKERDERRHFIKTQKNEIWAQQNGKCAGIDCSGGPHEILDPRTVEYDHIKSWADKGKTITQNGAALCPRCHKLKTHKEKLKKIDKRHKSIKSDSILGGNVFSKQPKKLSDLI